MSPLDLLMALGAGIVVFRAGSIANDMNGTTAHGTRAAVVVLAVGALAVALSPFYQRVEDWAMPLFVCGVAGWFCVGRRRIKP